ncbi:Protein TIC 21, chloroplastic -like protein [Gossypium arboreum]|uniref:Protein TIC 21, chloroplastic-like protein n=1 Tax=Gossypium arboreum TaxID=29729 RepID=A0A0B0MKF0_GOSAR|nr:Protein TIC 21, chloroplastic -like protein [Gossypium arboreum]
MQTLLLPATRSGICAVAVGPLRPSLTLSPPNFLTSIKTRKPKPPLSPFASYDPLNVLRSTLFSPKVSSSSVSPSFTSSNDDTDKAKLAQVSKRLENTSRYFKRLGNLGFWGQLVCTVVSAVILSFSVVITGKIKSPATFYATASGIVAAFISVFWSFGYIRLSEKLRRTANDPSKVEDFLGVIRDIECTRTGMKTKAPPRADVVKSLKNGIVLNLLGMGAAILGMQATVGLLVAKALTSSTNPYYQGISPGYSPVLALDVFLVQNYSCLRN